MACFLSLEDAATLTRLESLARDPDDFDNEDCEEIARASRALILRLATLAQGAARLRGPRDEPSFAALRPQLACAALVGLLTGTPYARDYDAIGRAEFAEACVAFADAVVAALGKAR